MSYQNLSGPSLDYDWCNYGASRLRFRGPFRMPQAIDVACIGGTETFGKFVAEPYPALLEQLTGRPVVNLGALNAGIDSFARDPVIGDVAARARVAVVQIMGAQGLSNAFYRVHSRRNDRVISTTGLFRRTFPRVDCADVIFVRHLLARLSECRGDGYAAVVAELRRTWVGRMRDLVDRLSVPVILLWMSDRAPTPLADPSPGISGGDPLFVTREMVRQVAAIADGLVEVVRPAGEDLDAMVCSPLERPAATKLPGPAAHVQAAEKLARMLEPMIGAVPLHRERNPASPPPQPPT